jgi:serine/threonine protein kinase
MSHDGAPGGGQGLARTGSVASDGSAGSAVREALEDGLVRDAAQFEQLEELGKGTFGVVLRVRRTRGGHCFALKQPHALGIDDSALAEIKEEMMALLRVNLQWMPTHQWDSTAFCPIVQARLRLRVTWPRWGAAPRYARYARQQCTSFAVRAVPAAAAQPRLVGSCPRLAPFPLRALATLIPDAARGAARAAAAQVRGLFLTPRLGLLLELYGVSLTEALRMTGPGALDEAARVTVARDVASACHFLHGAGVAHRDLKASNVLVDPANGFKARRRRPQRRAAPPLSARADASPPPLHSPPGQDHRLRHIAPDQPAEHQPHRAAGHARVHGTRAADGRLRR